FGDSLDKWAGEDPKKIEFANSIKRMAVAVGTGKDPGEAAGYGLVVSASESIAIEYYSNKKFDLNSKILIKGSPEHKEEVFRTLQDLTNDTLIMDENGYISIKKINNTGDKPTGTALIRYFMKSNEIITIVESSDRPTYNRKTKTINFNTNYDFGTKKQVALAHELIHGYHDIKGDFPGFNFLEYLVTGYGYWDSERQVRGLGKKYRNESITENTIRDEQGVSRCNNEYETY
ncbi:MAG: hypothetical protein GXY86_16085, partial [Firmicutes bacterium]|nr:hypothetical protein [Bacillota bacterium]